MEAELMTHMNQPCHFGLYVLSYFNRFGNGKVRIMFFKTQGIKHKDFGTSHFFALFFADGFGIGDIGEIAKAKALYRYLVVHYLYRNNIQVANLKGIVINPYKIYS